MKMASSVLDSSRWGYAMTESGEPCAACAWDVCVQYYCTGILMLGTWKAREPVLWEFKCLYSTVPSMHISWTAVGQALPIMDLYIYYLTLNCVVHIIAYFGLSCWSISALVFLAFLSCQSGLLSCSWLWLCAILQHDLSSKEMCTAVCVFHYSKGLWCFVFCGWSSGQHTLCSVLSPPRGWVICSDIAA